MNIGIYIYEQAEVLDFAGPFEVFSTAARFSPSNREITPLLIGQTGELVAARGGFQVLPHYAFATHPPLDWLVVPGGIHRPEMQKPTVIDWIREQGQQATLMASVCTGAFLLAQAGVLTTQTVTTHWDDVAELQQQFPTLRVVEDVRWVDEGNIITAAGISAGIDMSLHLVSRLGGTALAEKTARVMDYAWTPAA